MKTIYAAVAVSLVLAMAGCDSSAPEKPLNMNSNTKVTLTSPEGMHKNPAYSQLAIVEGLHKTVYIGGQNAVDSAGNIVGKGDFAEQTRQVLANLEKALQAGGAGMEHVVKFNLYVQQGQPLQEGFKVFQEPLSKLKAPPLISMIYVAGLAHPDYLLELDAIAVIPH
ncbi:RidA family protein [Paraflavitalea pollutisoli]|uniref:RidA family protein n=1 Tax=Paraflavitalea pollutisoli TaxID=3034143 RepID=UPI0023ECC77F|nr:RidA family protein [Paraflavitalea sp. H1-2-19X]